MDNDLLYLLGGKVVVVVGGFVLFVVVRVVVVVAAVVVVVVVVGMKGWGGGINSIVVCTFVCNEASVTVKTVIWWIGVGWVRIWGTAILNGGGDVILVCSIAFIMW